MSKYGLSSPGGRKLVIIGVVFGVVATASMVLRILGKRIKKQPLQLDDAFVAIAWVLLIPLLAVVLLAVTEAGLGHHIIIEVPLDDIILTTKLLLPVQVFYPLIAACVKTSLLILYRRIFHPFRGFDIVFGIILFIIWSWALASILMGFLICSLLEAAQNMTPAASCQGLTQSFIGAGAVNMFTDLVILVLPMPFLWRLQMSIWKKLGVMLFFCLGSFVTAISVIRMMALINLEIIDYTYNVTNSILWSILECELYIISANIPGSRPFFSKYVLRTNRDQSNQYIENSIPSSFNTNICPSASFRSKSSRMDTSVEEEAIIELQPVHRNDTTVVSTISPWQDNSSMTSDVEKQTRHEETRLA